jgi:hypothetical protein
MSSFQMDRETGRCVMGQNDWLSVFSLRVRATLFLAPFLIRERTLSSASIQQPPLFRWHHESSGNNLSIVNLRHPDFNMPPMSSTKKSSLTRRFTEMINQKTTRRPSSRDGTKENSLTPPIQTTTPSSSSSSPQSIQSRLTSSPQSTRYTIDEQHRLPVTFLPFVTSDTPFLKGFDVFGESKGSPKSSFEFNESPVEGSEDNWFSMSDDRSSAFDMLESRTRSHSKTTLPSSMKSVRIGWICEDGFKPIGEFE